MKRQILPSILLGFVWLNSAAIAATQSEQLSSLRQDSVVEGFQLVNLYSDVDGKAVGAKFRHVQSGVPIFVLQVETVPQVYMWVDTPEESNKGLAHALEHLLVGKGTKGKYLARLTQMRFGQMNASTYWDFNDYQASSAGGMEDFFDLFHAWLDALYRPDFSDIEAEREFYHFSIADNPDTKEATLVEQGTVYDEMES